MGHPTSQMLLPVNWMNIAAKIAKAGKADEQAC
jgi:hypothetical protein